MQRIADFTGKKILIVGASSGIGRQTAIRLNELGASVVLLARREEKLREIMEFLVGGREKFILYSGLES